MKLASKLISYLGSAFDKDPVQAVALKFSYDGNLNWKITDNVFTTTVSGGTGVSLALTLSDYTITELSDYLSSQAGYTSTYVNDDISSLSAITVMDGSGVQGDGAISLLAHQSLLWLWFDVIAKELAVAALSVTEMIKELVVGTSSTDWLNEWGDFYGIPRITDESNALYATRIASEVVGVNSTNLALEKKILDQAGMQATVSDIDWWYNAQLVNDLGFTSLAPGDPPAGGYPYWGLDINDNPVVCSFAVILGVVNVGALDPVTVATIKNIVNKYKAAGTHGRYFAPSGYFLNTNTAGEDTNNAVYLSGPKMQTYSEVTI